MSILTIVNHAQHLEMLRIPITTQKTAFFTSSTSTSILHSIVNLSDADWQIL